jgi:hypothetical protein
MANLNSIYPFTVAICIIYCTGQLSKRQLQHNGVVKSKLVNIIYNLYLYVQKLLNPSKQLVSNLYK